jgi:hypothetical protein
MTTYTINDLKALTIPQYEECRTRAIARVERRIGDKPTREQFQRELSPVWTLLDILALVVFIPALVVSSVHIIAHMGSQAAQAFQTSEAVQAGTIISQDFFVGVHQWMLIPLAEGSMILFLVMFGMSEGWRRGVYIALAIMAGIFVLLANWQSGIGPLESMLAPAFTIGIGLKLEHIILELLKRRHLVDKQYLEALAVYEAATQDATQHPDYQPMLRQEVWVKLVSLKANQAFMEAPTGFKHQAVKREMARDQWAYEEGVAQTEFTPSEGEESKPTDIPFGSTAPGWERAVPESIPMTQRANGHGGEPIVQRPN